MVLMLCNCVIELRCRHGGASETEGQCTYTTTVRPPDLYWMGAAEAWATMNGHVARLEVNEMRIPRLMWGVTKKDGIRNERI